ncbi:MAG: AzlD domain-containing protein [Treponema sp.]|nr:AzlD domain-containing protein [Treponema sp.]
MNTAPEAFVMTLVMGAVIFFCRFFPFLFFGGKNLPPADQNSGKQAFLNFVEKIVPPVAMTVLAFNDITGRLGSIDWGKGGGGLLHAAPVLAAALVTAVLHIRKRNPLLSIFGGTALFMLLERIIQ